MGVGEVCPVHCRMFNSIPALHHYALPTTCQEDLLFLVVTTRNVSDIAGRPQGNNQPQLRTVGLRQALSAEQAGDSTPQINGKVGCRFPETHGGRLGRTEQEIAHGIQRSRGNGRQRDDFTCLTLSPFLFTHFSTSFTELSV